MSEAPQLLVQTGRENQVIDSPRPISFHPLRVADIGGYGVAGIALMVTAISPTATVTFQFGGSLWAVQPSGFQREVRHQARPDAHQTRAHQPEQRDHRRPVPGAPGPPAPCTWRPALPRPAAPRASPASGLVIAIILLQPTAGLVSGKLTIIGQVTDYREDGAFLQRNPEVSLVSFTIFQSAGTAS